jgi:hypothetical protein
VLTSERKQLINKRLAHITDERAKDPAPWEVDAFIRTLEIAVRAFVWGRSHFDDL